MKKFVDVILPLPLPRCFTYSLPEEWADEVQMGCRVVVPFGRKKYYTAIVRNVHYCEPMDYEVKEVSTLLDARPILLPEQFKFWEWLADYYLCTQGDVYKAALPSGLKLESETMIEYNPDFESEVRLPEPGTEDIGFTFSRTRTVCHQVGKKTVDSRIYFLLSNLCWIRRLSL